MLLSFLPWYLFRWLENSESTDKDGWTLTITSLAWYAIRATVRRGNWLVYHVVYDAATNGSFFLVLLLLLLLLLWMVGRA